MKLVQFLGANKFLASVAATVGLLASFSASALTLAPTVGPSDVAVTCSNGDNTGNDIPWLAGAPCSVAGALTTLYKKDAGGGESGPASLQAAYSMTFSPAGDFSEATLTWSGGAAITCGICWVVVKDGNQDPARYAFNLSGGLWNGTETINFTGFWAGNNGAISHIGIYGRESDICTVDCGPNRVPEPGTLALMGAAIAAASMVRRRRHGA